MPDDPELVHECKVVPVEPQQYGEISETVYEVMNTTDMDQESLSGIPVVSAKPLDQPPSYPAVITPDVASHSFIERGACEIQETPQSSSFTRPEFIFASALLEEGISVENLGITLQRRRKTGTEIGGLSPDSPFVGSNLRPGDHIIAINNWCCARYTLDRVQELIRASKETLSICVHNKHGDPALVSSSIMKPHPASRVGITLKRRYNVIRIKLMSESSLFGNTLLTQRQRLVSINGVACGRGQTARSASDLIGAASKRVTIVSEIDESCAVTIALYERAKWWHKWPQ